MLVAALVLPRLIATVCDHEVIVRGAVDLLSALTGKSTVGVSFSGLSPASRIAATLVRFAVARSICPSIASRLLTCVRRLRRYDGVDMLCRVPGLQQVLQRMSVRTFPVPKGRRVARLLLRLLGFPSNPVACERAVAQAVLQRLSSVTPPATCGICHDDAEGALLLTPCGHAFHARCLEVWVLKLYAVDADGEVSDDDDDDDDEISDDDEDDVSDNESTELAHVNGCPMCRSGFVVRRERKAWD